MNGRILLLGSGETLPQGGQAVEETIRGCQIPLHMAFLETPAGFELNSGQVIQRVMDYYAIRLQNYHPILAKIPARRRDDQLGTNNTDILIPLLTHQVIFMGPGSPTYVVKTMANSLAWQVLAHANSLGTNLILASAAVTAFGKLALPVYEIYKAGRNPFWAPGLNYFSKFGLELVFIPHWNNTDGGKELDTSRCFIGQERFLPLLNALGDAIIVVGIDELTGLLFIFSEERCKVIGKGQVHLVQNGQELIYANGESFPFAKLGLYHNSKEIKPGRELLALLQQIKETSPDQRPDSTVLDLVKQRESARQNRDWQLADELRRVIYSLGWSVADTPEGPKLDRV